MKTTITMIVADIMMPHVLTIDKQATVTEAIALMQDHHVRSLIIESTNDREGHGIITERDIVYSVISRCLDPQKIRVSEVMRSPCVPIFADATIEEATRRRLKRVFNAPQLLGLVQNRTVSF